MKLIDDKLKDWVSTRLLEYLGSTENDIIEFVLQLLESEAKPEKFLEEVLFNVISHLL